MSSARIEIPVNLSGIKNIDEIIDIEKLSTLLSQKNLQRVGITADDNPFVTKSYNGVYISITGNKDRNNYVLDTSYIPAIGPDGNYIIMSKNAPDFEKITIHLSFHYSRLRTATGEPTDSQNLGSKLHVKEGSYYEKDFVGRKSKINCKLLNDPERKTLQIVNVHGFREQIINFWDLQKKLIESISQLMTMYYDYIIQKKREGDEDVEGYTERDVERYVERYVERHAEEYEGDYEAAEEYEGDYYEEDEEDDEEEDVDEEEYKRAEFDKYEIQKNILRTKMQNIRVMPDYRKNPELQKEYDSYDNNIIKLYAEITKVLGMSPEKYKEHHRDYFKKYLKYKMKYLDLKKTHSLTKI